MIHHFILFADIYDPFGEVSSIFDAAGSHYLTLSCPPKGAFYKVKVLYNAVLY